MSRIYTDLAMESGRVGAGEQVEGVRIARSESGGVTRLRVDVLNERGERETGKRPGAYVTLYSDGLDNMGGDEWSALTDMLAGEISALTGLDEVQEAGVLVLGLGNRQVTPDAIGPRVADMVLSTRALQDEAGIPGLRRVMTAAPGVYGATGIEVEEVVKGLVRELRPGAIIAIDALCARDPGRIANTIQLSDAGIQPGSGVGNHRAALSRDTLGVRVAAIGVPTVVYARSIVADALERAGAQSDGRLADAAGDMIVAPRSIDSLVERASRLIADALNRALQPELTSEDLRWLTV